jgi:hypothetical protein
VFAQSDADNENTFTLGAQLRPRAEHRNGAFFPRTDETDPASFINNRARISMDYKREKLALGFSAQHVGVWGQDPPMDSNGRFMLNEAWANITPGGGFFFKLGRQSLAYDDERILGASDWHVSGRYHDALKLGFENVQNKLHVILAFNQNSEKQFGGTYYAPGGQPYKTMQTLWYQYTESKSFNVSFLLMNLGLEAGYSQKTDVKNFQTLGTNLSFRPNDFQLLGTFYYQTGKTVTNKSIAAYMVAINASYQINPTWKIILASDYLSGDDSSKADKFKAFNPVYGTNHKFYGTMDYFYASPFIINGLNPGLWDNQLGLAYKASPKVTLALNYHHFQTATDVLVGGKKLSSSLGSELDFQLTWNVMKDVTLTGGYSTMFGNDAMKAVKGGDPSKWQDWTWVSLNINPKVFITKW